MQSAAAQREPELFVAPAIMPWEYIQMRRMAAGLSIEQAAKRFYARDDHRSSVIANLIMFETPGVRIKRISDVDLKRAFEFDAEVYRQLVETPPDEHPTLCRKCGWDEWTSEVDTGGHEVTWSEALPNTCTRCEQIYGRRR